jgi:hypothetical protein
VWYLLADLLFIAKTNVPQTASSFSQALVVYSMHCTCSCLLLAASPQHVALGDTCSPCLQVADLLKCGPNEHIS